MKEYKYNDVKKDHTGALRITFANNAGDTIVMDTEKFCAYLPGKNDMHSIKPVEFSYAAADVIQKGYDW